MEDRPVIHLYPAGKHPKDLAPPSGSEEPESEPPPAVPNEGTVTNEPDGGGAQRATLTDETYGGGETPSSEGRSGAVAEQEVAVDAEPETDPSSDDDGAEASEAEGKAEPSSEPTPADPPPDTRPPRESRPPRERRKRPVPPPPPVLPAPRPDIRYGLDNNVPVKQAVIPDAINVPENGTRKELLAHQDFVNWFYDRSSDAQQVKRARFVLVQIARTGFAPGTKGVKGVSSGWLRAPLGGTAGSHFYLWYAQGGTALGTQLGLTDGQVLIRSVRHHDATDQAMEATGPSDWLPFTGSDVLTVSDESPFTPDQLKIARNTSAPVQIVRGYPGSGKTTALLLSALQTANEKILYLTFNSRLVGEAHSFFRSYLPEGSVADVLPFQSFVEELAQAVPGTMPMLGPADAAGHLADVLVPHVVNKYGEWTDVLADLYDELHAHAFGRSLPFNFRGINASPGLHVPTAEYERVRRNSLGHAAADAARLLTQLSVDQQTTLFPGPVYARSLLANVDEPVPERFRDVGLILVDEVQDLTPVELLLVLNVAARVGVESGLVPRLILAGDESQTVRPTAFEWAWVQPLIRSVLPNVQIETTALDMNLRSPKDIGRMVEATQEQYRLLDKDFRPAGQAQTTLDETSVGRVIYSASGGIDVEDVLDLASQIPRCAVVYPGAMLPDDVYEVNADETALASIDAKGLDFETVIVLDAGKHQSTLQTMLAGDQGPGKAVVRARTLADQFRVAVSRSTFNLVLLDRHGNYAAELGRLFPPSKRWPFEMAEFADLASDLETEEDAEALLWALVNEVEPLLGSNTSRALARSRSGSRRLARLLTQQGVGADLVQAVRRAHGLAAALALTDTASTMSDAERSELQAEADTNLPEAGLADLYESFRQVLILAADPASWVRPTSESWLDALDRVAPTASNLGADIPILAERLERILLRWLDQLPGATLPRTDAAASRAAGTARAVADAVLGRKDLAHDRLETALTSWARTACTLNLPAIGLLLLDHTYEPHHEQRAECHEVGMNFAEACNEFEMAGRIDDAIRCARRGGDINRALALNGDTNSDLAALLRWQQATVERLGEEASKRTLLPEEVDRLRQVLDKAAEIGPTIRPGA